MCGNEESNEVAEQQRLMRACGSSMENAAAALRKFSAALAEANKQALGQLGRTDVLDQILADIIKQAKGAKHERTR